MSCNEKVNSLAFSMDGSLLITGSNDSDTWIVDVASGRVLKQISCVDEIGAVAFSPDGTRFATGSRKGVIQIWRTPW
jgi:WD40 repeat protein